ncbi:hypothetical protein [Aeromonas cavernicola]|nr:hypothetical protein [Aeromonas cavernicola]
MDTVEYTYLVEGELDIEEKKEEKNRAVISFPIVKTASLNDSAIISVHHDELELEIKGADDGYLMKFLFIAKNKCWYLYAIRDLSM